MRDRVDEWTNNIKNSNLPPRSVWLSYKSQLWSGLKYGLGALSAKLEDLESKKKNGRSTVWVRGITKSSADSAFAGVSTGNGGTCRQASAVWVSIT